MKTGVCVFALIGLAACVTPPDAPQKIEDCRKITDKNFRDLCIADALEEERQAELFEETFDEETSDLVTAE